MPNTLSHINGTAVGVNDTVAVTNGSVTVINTTGTGVNNVTFSPTTSFAGVTTFQYTITDDGGLTDTETVTVTVGDCCAITINTPTVTACNNGLVDVTISVTAVHTSSNVLNVSVVESSTTVQSGTINLSSGAGSITFSDIVANGETWNITVADQSIGYCSTAEALVLPDCNQPPIAVADSASTDCNTPISFNLLGNDSDGD